MIRSLGILPILLCLTVAVLALENGGSYDCDSKPWIVGNPFTITFYIDRSKWPSMCIGGTNGLPNFQSSPDDSPNSYSSNCSVSTDIRNDCSFTPGTLGCGCTTDSNSTHYVAEYNFIAQPDYDPYWKPTIACLEDGTFAQLLSFSGYCYTPDKSPPTTEPPTTHVSTPNTTAPPCLCYFCDCDCGCDKNWGCWLCIIICIVLALLSICLIIWCIYRFCRKKCEKCCPCCAGFFKCIDKCLESCMCCAFCRPGSQCCSDVPRDVPPTTDPEDNCGDESKPVPISLTTTANKPTSYASPNNADNLTTTTNKGTNDTRQGNANKQN